MKRFLHIVNNLRSKIVKGELNKERLLLVFIITVLVVIWFRKGLILGSGESGLPFYNTSRFLELLKSNWTDVPLGSGGSIGFPSFSLYATTTFLQNLNVPSYLIQAGMFWLIFVVGVLSVFQIASSIKGNTPLTRFSAALFYIFNPIVHVTVLHRFQYPEIFFYSFMPLALLIYFKGLKHKNFIYLIFLSLISLIFSFTFVGPAFTELFFGVIALLTVYYFLSTFKEKKDYFPLLYFPAFVIIFMLVNLWWLAPLLGSVSVDLGSRGSVKYFNQNENVTTFESISGQIESVLSVFRLFKPNAYNIDEAPWIWIYYTVPFILLSFFSIAAFIFGLFKKEKQFLYKFLMLLSVVTMFWVKGSLSPFGGITLLTFKSFTFLQVLRNPFEKVGMLLPLAMAIPIGFGTVMIINFFAAKTKISKKIVTALIIIFVFPVYMFPIMSDLAFTGGPPPANNVDIGQYVQVPDYYRQAREWLSKQPGLFRVLVLPIDGEGMTYKWDYGFNGVELSNNLFNQPMISLSTSQGYLPEMVNSIKYTLHNYPEKLSLMAQILNVRYIIVRDDIDYIGRETEAPATDSKLIEDKMQEYFKLAAEFGKLKIYELKPDSFYPRIFTSTSQIYLSDQSISTEEALKLLPLSRPGKNEIFITSEKALKSDPDIQSVNTTMLGGKMIENIGFSSKDPIEALPFVSIFRGTPFYALVRLKEDIQNQLISPDNQLGYNVNLLGKRLAEINYSPQDNTAISEYYDGVKFVISQILASSQIDRVVIEQLNTQQLALKEIKKKSENPIFDRAISDLDKLFIQAGARSIYPTDDKLIYRFNVLWGSSYEILLSSQDWSKYYDDKEISQFQIDGRTIKLDPPVEISDADNFSLGVYSFGQGQHEVSISEPKIRNLIAEKLPDELELSSKDSQPVTKVLPIAQLNAFYNYKLSFEYLEEKGNVPVVSVHSDADFTDKKGERIPRFAIALMRDNYYFGWKSYAGTFTPFPSAKDHNISFKVLPFGDCKAVVQRPYRRYCEDNDFNQRILRDSSYKIRNLKMEKVLQNPIILRQVGSDTTKISNPPNIKFEQISSARYKVKVTNAQKPFFLVLSTSFDPRWAAYFINNRPKNFVQLISGSIPGDPVASSAHLEVNGYANAWYVDKSGDYEMFLEYSPEVAFTLGWKLSALVIISLLIFTVFYTAKRIKCSIITRLEK